jgi:hypothetical protein
VRFISHLFILSACTSLTPPSTSSLDADYQWRQLQTQGIGSESPGVAFYQKALSQTLGSHCTYFPSDSIHAQNLFRRCGPAVGIVRAMGRFYLEPDAPRLGYPIFIRGGHVYFKEIRTDCDVY